MFVTVYRTCTEYFAVIYPLKMILSARLPINCINLRTSRLEKLENNLIKLFFGLRNGEYAYSIVFKITENELQPPVKHGVGFKKEKKKTESYSMSSDDEASNDGHSSTEFKDEYRHKTYQSSTDDEHESLEESNEHMSVTLTFGDEQEPEDSSPDSISFVTWEDALSGKIDINADGQLVNSAKSEFNKPTLNELLGANNPMPSNGRTTTNSNLLSVRTDEHRRRLSLQTIPESGE